NNISALTEKPKAAPAEEPPKRKCPFCMTEIHDEATRCPSCTSVLPV
ncbi:MAG: large conductance mechanosensitive channel protein MscL, partial [Peptococcaceae bacterium]|nr:large conductance mechanosensitive channel protein MscL [Peptococcaceae bacterium]